MKPRDFPDWARGIVTAKILLIAAGPTAKPIAARDSSVHLLFDLQSSFTHSLVK